MEATRDWLQLWARTKQVGVNDRVMHELNCLVDMMFYASTFDQVNAPALASFEVLARRFQTILDAYRIPGRAPNWQMARFYSGVTAAVDAIAPELRQYGAKRAKEESDRETGTQRARGLPGAGGGAGSEDALEGAPGEPPREALLAARRTPKSKTARLTRTRGDLTRCTRPFPIPSSPPYSSQRPGPHRARPH